MNRLSRDFQIHLLADPRDALIAVSFESVAERLQAIDRVYFEMDGSFVWTGSDPDAWQLDGMVYDLGSSIQRVELKGRCPRSPWDLLLKALNHPQQSLVVYDLQSAQFADVARFEAELWSS